MREDALKQVLRQLGVSNWDRRVDKRRKVWLNAVCPFGPFLHKNGGDRTPSFGVVVDDEALSSFKCYGCKQHGTINKLVRLLGAYRRQDYDAILAEARSAERSGRVYPDFDAAAAEELETIDPIEEAIWDGLFDPIGRHRPAAEFMRRRRVGKDTADKLGLQFDPEQGRIIFPVRGAEGELYGFTGRTIRDDARVKVRDYAGLPKWHLILGRERWTPGKPVLLVEGLFAYGRMHEIGAEEVANVGALLGSEMTEGKAKVVIEFGATTVLMLDPDEAGDAGTFGRWDEAEQRHVIEDSAVGRLWGHVPLVVPDYPEMDEPDPDNLTLDQVRAMITQPLWRPDRQQAKQLSKAGIGWTRGR